MNLSFLTTAVTLSRIRELVLNEERMLAELQAARSKLESMEGRRDGPRKVEPGHGSRHQMSEVNDER